MNTKLIELRNQKKEIVTARAKISEVAVSEKRGYSGEEQEKYDSLLAQETVINNAIKDLELNDIMDKPSASLAEAFETRSSDPKHTPEYRNFVKKLSADHNEAVKFFTPTPEQRAYSNTSTTGGPFIPEAWANSVVEGIDNLTVARKMSNLLPVFKGDSFNLPVFGGINAATRVGETSAATEDSSTLNSSKQFTPIALAAKLSLSRLLLNNAIIDMDGLIRREFARQIAYKTEAEFCTGTGSSQFLGVFTASASGIPSSQDLNTGTASTIKWGDLVNTKFSISSKYHNHPKSAWLMHGNTMKLLLGMVDSAGRPVITTDVKSGAPATIIDSPVYISEYAPGNPVSGQYALAYGCFEFYVMAENTNLSIEIMPNPETDSSIYYGRILSDAKPTLGTAFARLKVL